MRLRSKFKFKKTRLFNKIRLEPYITKINIWNDKVLQKIKIYKNIYFFNKNKNLDKDFTKIVQYTTDEIILKDNIKKFDIKMKNMDNIYMEDNFIIKEINIGEKNNV